MEEKLTWGIFVSTDDEVRKVIWTIESNNSGPVTIEDVSLKNKIKLVIGSNMKASILFRRMKCIMFDETESRYNNIVSELGLGRAF